MMLICVLGKVSNSECLLQMATRFLLYDLRRKLPNTNMYVWLSWIRFIPTEAGPRCIYTDAMLLI